MTSRTATVIITVAFTGAKHLLDDRVNLLLADT